MLMRFPTYLSGEHKVTLELEPLLRDETQEAFEFARALRQDAPLRAGRRLLLPERVLRVTTCKTIRQCTRDVRGLAPGRETAPVEEQPVRRRYARRDWRASRMGNEKENCG